MLWKRIVFAALLLAAHAGFAWTLWRYGRMILAGKPENRFDQVPERLRSVLEYFLGQKKVVEDVPIPAKRGDRLLKALGSRHHVFIFWGFLLITVGTLEIFVKGVFPTFTFALVIGDTAAALLNSTIDVANAIVLAMIVFAFVRRLAMQPRLIPMSRDAALILSAIGLLMISHFGWHAFALVAHGHSPDHFVGPLSRTLSAVVSGTPAGVANVLAEASFWVHVAILLLFLNYLLYSKHSHIVAALPNIYFRNLGKKGVLPKLNLEADDMAQTGIVSEYKDFSWKSLMDGFACTECARCTNMCPAYNTGKPLSPMQIVHDVRDDLRTRMPDRGPLDALIDRMQHGAHAEPPGEVKPLVGGRTSEETLWACTTCGACQEVCPVFIDQPKMILEMRRNLVLLQEKVPPDLARTFKNLEQNGNPWGIGAHKRMDWAEGRARPVPTLDDKPDAEYLLWVGCAGAYDDRIKKQTLALVDILEEGGVDFAVLGLEEGCTGDPARRSGNEMLYQMQAQQNVETMNAKKVKKVITACPHCLHTIANEYPQLGGNFEVKHHTQVIRDLVESGKVVVEKDAEGTKRVTFHDPCYLGRWNGEYDAPRAALDALGSPRIEPPRAKEHGFCCGAGGGRMWMEEKIGTRVNHDRVDELISTGANTIATACPFCTIMVNDGVNDRGKEDKVQVLNVSEVVARSMVRKRELEAAKS